ncbi:MAG: NEL-type E3 ubiquitin ligase domain-containing protein [Chlamydiales bacterium]
MAAVATNPIQNVTSTIPSLERRTDREKDITFLALSCLAALAGAAVLYLAVVSYLPAYCYAIGVGSIIFGIRGVFGYLKHSPVHQGSSPVHQGPQSHSPHPAYQALCRTAEVENPIVLYHLKEHEDELVTWLERLSYMRDYQNNQTEVAKLVYQMIKKAEEESEFRNVFVGCLQEASTTCGDRMALFLIKMGINYDIEVAKQANNLPRLAHLIGHGSWVLDELEEIARNKISELRNGLGNIDEIEVLLAYPIKLKERLNLPIRTNEMSFFHLSTINDQDLEIAADILRPTLHNSNEYSKRLIEYPVWVEALKISRPVECNQIEQQKAAELENLPNNAVGGDYIVIEENYKARFERLTRTVLLSFSRFPFV